MKPSPLPSLLLGLVLGLSILKLGNPVILEQSIGIPDSISEWVHRPWPTRIGLFLLGGVATFHLFATPWLKALASARLPRPVWLALGTWILTLAISHAGSVDPHLSRLTLPHLLSVAVAFVLGVCCAHESRQWPSLLLGIGIGAALCWVQAFNQHNFEFRYAREALITGQAAGWTNISPAEFQDLRQSGLIIQTNGTHIANPAILDKLTRGRVHGSLVYPNALAGLVLLVLPALATGLWTLRDRFRPLILHLFLGVLLLLGISSLVWSGSRSGWLIGVGLAAAATLLHPRLKRIRIPLAAAALGAGLLVFGIRNRDYFRGGATSVSARLDYWKAALQITRENPLKGSGPGTFMRPYARLKAPEAEMTRLVHNDFLQQFSDSGMPAGLAYLVWILGSLGVAWSRLARSPAPLPLALLLGTTAWFLQGLSEFSLYVPPLAWIAFCFLGIASATTPPTPASSENPTTQRAAS